MADHEEDDGFRPSLVGLSKLRPKVSWRPSNESNSTEQRMSYGTNCSSDPGKRQAVVFHDPKILLRELGASRSSPSSKRKFKSQGEHVSACETIQVALRIRPKLKRDEKEADVVRIETDGKTVALLHVGDDERATPSARSRPHRSKDRMFQFNHVFDSRCSNNPATQKTIFDVLGRRIVQGAIDGYNGCLFAYGQTGTGKTHSVVGHSMIPSDRGLLPRILESVFLQMDSLKQQTGQTCSMKCSFLEIFNENIHDLLVPPKIRKEDRTLNVRYTPHLGLVISGLSEVVASNIEESRELLDFGMKMRSMASTSMNSRSSRAHTVFTFRLEQGNSSGEMKISQVQIVDLAGREQGKTSGDNKERLRERAFINKSLLYLSTCIQILAKNPKKNPEWAFRNSKLTMVLSHFLGKNSRTAMIAAISPSASDYDETLSTLRFASHVSVIKTEASCNNVNRKDVVSELNQEIEALKEQMLEHSLQNAAHENRELQEQVSQLEALIDQYRESLEQEQTYSRQLADERREALEALGLSVHANGSAISVGTCQQGLPYLVNLSEDPFLEGCLMYFLKCGEETTLGSGDDNKIRLDGVGIAPHHCSISNTDGEHLTLTVAADVTETGGVPRTFLNGKRVSISTPLHHQDQLVLGHAYAFLVQVPAAASKCPRRAGIDLDNGLPHAEDPSSTLVKNLGQFVENLEASAKIRFMKQVGRAVSFCEEATLISRKVRPEDGLEFRPQVLTDLLSPPVATAAPELVIAVMAAGSSVPDYNFHMEEGHTTSGTWTSKQGTAQVGQEMNDSAGSAVGQKALKFTWSMDKFCRRLQVMRDFYEEQQELGLDEMRKHLRQKPFCDPWKEIGSGEVQMLLEGLGLAPDRQTSQSSTEPNSEMETGSECNKSSDGSQSDEGSPKWFTFGTAQHQQQHKSSRTPWASSRFSQNRQHVEEFSQDGNGGEDLQHREELHTSMSPRWRNLGARKTRMQMWEKQLQAKRGVLQQIHEDIRRLKALDVREPIGLSTEG